jgi:hypothetical protein
LRRDSRLNKALLIHRFPFAAEMLNDNPALQKRPMRG